MNQNPKEMLPLRANFTAVVEQDGDWYVAHCLEIPGTSGQGRSVEEARESLAEALALVLREGLSEMFAGEDEEPVRPDTLH